MNHNNIEKKYVVLDVETNGLSSLNDDLLSISIYKPDENKMYNRFLPLELNGDVYTTYINGITKKDLKGKQPLSQEEMNNIIDEFELQNRIILTYGNIDEKFIKNYLKRKKLKGYEVMNFYNFKHDIISSKFSGGVITKDNLCKIYGIDNVLEVHSGSNDCILEWELFKKMNGKKLFVTGRNVFEFNNDYIIPVSYLSTYPNFKYCVGNLPKIEYKSRVVKKFEVSSRKIKKFSTNISGMTIEHLINTMLDVEKIHSELVLLENKRKLKFIGRLPSPYDDIMVNFNTDGTITATNEKDEKFVNEVNKVINILKKEIQPLVEYISNNIFNNQKIFSQELVIHKEKNILALCDLSNDNTVLEIKTNYNLNIDQFKEQLYYESNGRTCYILQIDWFNIKKGITFIISKVELFESEKSSNNLLERKNNFQSKINNDNIVVIEYKNYDSDVKVKCSKCNKEWYTSYRSIISKPYCPNCDENQFIVKRKERKIKEVLTAEEKQKIKYNTYAKKVLEKSNGKIKALSYTNSKEKVKALCLECGHKWDLRADHLLERCKCPICKSSK